MSKTKLLNGTETSSRRGVRQTQTADLQTADLQTCIPADLQTRSELTGGGGN